MTHGTDVVIYHGDALDVLPKMEPESVDAVVTSPPYTDLRHGDYESPPPEKFVEWYRPFVVSIRHVLKPTGGFMLNLGRKFKNGCELDYVERTLRMVQEEVAFNRIDTIIWGKINGRPINPYLTNAHEYVYWFVSGRALDAYRGFDAVRSPYSEATLERYQRTWDRQTVRKGQHGFEDGRTPHPEGSRPTSIYVTQIGKEKGIQHPAPMALDLARFLVCLACPPGGTVLDPMLGSGTTAVAARLHGRRCIGVESIGTHVDEAHDRLDEVPEQLELTTGDVRL